MTAFFKSFSPILKRLNKLKIKRYLLEVALLSVAIIITIISLIIYTKNNSEEKITPEVTKASSTLSHIKNTFTLMSQVQLKNQTYIR